MAKMTRRAKAQSKARRAKNKAEATAVAAMHRLSDTTVEGVRALVEDMRTDHDFDLVDLWAERVLFLTDDPAALDTVDGDEFWEGFASRVSRNLSNQLLERRIEVIEHVQDFPDCDVDLKGIQCDDATTRLLATKNIATPDAILVASLLEQVELVRDGDEPILLEIRERPDFLRLWARIGLGQGLFWEPGVITGLPPMEDEMRRSMIGEPLQDLLPHPVLDDLDLVVTDWTGDKINVDGLKWKHVIAV